MIRALMVFLFFATQAGAQQPDPLIELEKARADLAAAVKRVESAEKAVNERLVKMGFKPLEAGTAPVVPVPQPTTAPIAAEGFHVLIIYQDKFPLSKEQHAAIYGKEIRDYLNAKCPREPSGIAGWRIWDAELDVSLAPKHFQDAFNRTKARPDLQLPWIIVSNGKGGFEGPLPVDTMALLKKWGGE